MDTKAHTKLRSANRATARRSRFSGASNINGVPSTGCQSKLNSTSANAEAKVYNTRLRQLGIHCSDHLRNERRTIPLCCVKKSRQSAILKKAAVNALNPNWKVPRLMPSR